MTAIDPAKAVDAMSLLESVIRGVDPEFKPQPQPVGLHAALGAFAATPAHKAKAMAIGQNVEALATLARRQMAEVATTIKNIMATMPEGDANAANIASVIEVLE